MNTMERITALLANAAILFAWLENTDRWNEIPGAPTGWSRRTNDHPMPTTAIIHSGIVTVDIRVDVKMTCEANGASPPY